MHTFIYEKLFSVFKRPNRLKFKFFILFIPLFLSNLNKFVYAVE